MKKIILFIMTGALLACNAANVSESEELNARISRACENRAWLDHMIEELKAQPTKGRVTQYTYQGQTVFLVEPCMECADTMSGVYACDGTALCTFGGIAGFNTCPDFFETATDKKIIWHN